MRLNGPHLLAKIVAAATEWDSGGCIKSKVYRVSQLGDISKSKPALSAAYETVAAAAKRTQLLPSQ